MNQLEHKEGTLWRITLLLMVLLATATGISFWENLQPRGFAVRLPGSDGIAAGVVLLMVLFAGYVWLKRREIADLRGFIRGMEARDGAIPSEEQLERLLSVVARSQQGYRDLIDSFDDLVFTLSLDGEVLAANRSVSALLDQPFSQVVGRCLDEFVEDPGRAAVEKALPWFMEKRHWQGVVRVRLKSGAVRYLECVLQAIIKQDQVTGISCIARDVTQQRESEQRFKELFETLQEGVYFTTPEGTFLDANPTLIHMLGYAHKEELLERNVRDLYADPAARTLLLEAMNQHGMVRNHEIVLHRKDGSTLICLDTSSAIRDSSGKVVRYQGALVDVTERRQMEKRLHEEQEFARRLVASFPDLIIVLDRDQRYTFVSPNITTLLGFQPEDLIGRVVGERSHPDDREAMAELVRGVLSGETTFGTLEYRTQHKDGSWRTFRAAASPLYGPTPPPCAENPNDPSAPAKGGRRAEIRGLIASSRDFTEFKRLEQQVIQSEKLAAMGQMIAGVAHELNNPLTAIVGISDLLREQTSQESSPASASSLATQHPSAQALSRQLDLVNQQARRAANIVSNLLSFSRPTVAQKSLVNLNHLVQRTLALHEYALRVNNIAIDFLKVPDLPAVLADSNQLMQVFLNLIVNAEQAILAERARRGAPPSTQGTLRVRLGLLPADDVGAGSHLSHRPSLPMKPAPAPDAQRVWVTFEDDGPGIPPDVLPKIFDPFFTTKRPGRGTGLGLSICMALVREHGGEIEAMDAPGGGAKFRILLPPSPAGASALIGVEAGLPRQGFPGALGTPDAMALSTLHGVGSKPTLATAIPWGREVARDTDAQGQGRPVKNPLEGCRVLVVDDEESIRELVEAGLSARGLIVDCAPSGEVALQRAQQQDYDLVLCDLKMPGLGGEQVYTRMRALAEVPSELPLASPESLRASSAPASQGTPPPAGLRRPFPPFIFMTGDVLDPEAARLAGLLDAHFVQKPFRISDLMPVLAEVLGQSARALSP